MLNCSLCVCVCLSSCVHVRVFMHQPGNCRCWFVCIQGSACSRSQEPSLKATSSSELSSFKLQTPARTRSLLRNILFQTQLFPNILQEKNKKKNQHMLKTVPCLEMCCEISKILEFHRVLRFSVLNCCQTNNSSLCVLLLPVFLSPSQ